MRRSGWVVAAAIAMAAGGCAHSGGLRHRVQRGENLYRIGLAYGVSYQDLARANAIGDPHRIAVGDVLLIPGATRELPVKVITPERAQAERPQPDELPAGRRPFAWPVAAPAVMSEFGPRAESHHDGIDLRCGDGEPVRAARAGRVLYSDSLRGYGNIVILDHDDDYATVYAHNRENRAAVGQSVGQGEVIALCGQSGQTAEANLHFEVRKANVARNPLFYLPPLPVTTAAQ